MDTFYFKEYLHEVFKLLQRDQEKQNITLLVITWEKSISNPRLISVQQHWLVG